MGIEHAGARLSLAKPLANNGAAVLRPDSSAEVDYSILNESRRAAARFPLEIFGPQWGDWVMRAAESCAAPVDYVAASVLVGGATAIGNSRWPRPWDGWQEPPVLWIGLIGGPSTGKSPGMDAALDALRTLEQEAAADYPEQLREWQAKQEAAKCAEQIWRSQVKDAVENGKAPPVKPESAVEPEKPARPRMIISDVTQEEIGALLAVTPKGVLSWRDEVGGWLGSFDRYGGGGERAFWIEANGGRFYVIDRRKNDGTPTRVPHLTINVLGGIQPDKLASSLLSGDDDGLASRFLCVWPEPVQLTRPKRTPDPQFAVSAFRRLRGLEMATTEHGTPTYIAVPFSEEAAALLDEWRGDHFKIVQGASGRFASHLGKQPGMLIRLALVLEFLWWSVGTDPEPRTIGKKAVTAAAGLIDGYFKPMAERAYGDAAVPEPERHAAAIAKWIMRERPVSVNPRELRHKKGLPGLRETGQVKAALDVLIDAGWLEGPAPGVGHRGRNDYIVRPAVYKGAS
jgi:Protein of unknown function (DUF3987)